MKQADFSIIKKRVLDVARDSAIGEHTRNVVVEADRDDTGSDFLRIVFEVDSLDDVSDAELLRVIGSIETAIAELDERFPSVRFADAA
jgi:hypothetical protein